MKKRVVVSMATAVCMVGMLAGCGSSDAGSDAVSEAAVEETEETETAEADENGNYVVNGSFEEADFTGWDVTNIDDVTEELDIYAVDTDSYEGAQSLHFYSGSNDVNFTAEQTISGLEEGTYKLTGHIQGDTAGDEDASVYFYAVIDGETYTADATLGGYVNWYTSELADLDVTSGEITIGVSVSIAPGGWGTIDDITLVKE